MMWTGATSTDWSVGSNWSKGVVPSTSVSAIITAYPTNQPQITTDVSSPTEIDNLTVRGGAELTIDAGKALTVNGDLSNEGTILVKADATGIGSLITEGTITGAGTFAMEQYLTGSGGGTPNGLFYYVGSPVVGATASDFNIAGGNKLWIADETTTSYPQITNGLTALDPMTGYVVRMGANGSVTYRGSAYNTGAIAITGLTRTGTTDANRGYNLVSNPYPSTVDWRQVDTTNLYGTIWFRTHNAGNVMLYDTYNAMSDLGTSLNHLGEQASRYIAPTQAFWVRVKDDESTASVNFTNDMRSHGTLAGIYRLEAEEGTVRLKLGNGTASDEAIIHFTPDASDGFDAFDSQKFWAAASVPQLYTTTGADSLVINGLESVATNPVVDLGVKLPTTGNYSFTATDITLANEVWLEDRLLNIFQDLNLDATYDFTDEAGNIPTRFALHFGVSITDIRNTDGFRTQVFSSGNEVNIILSEATNGIATVYDMAGKLIATENMQADRTRFQLNVTTGIYIVQIQTNKGTSNHKIHLQ